MIACLGLVGNRGLFGRVVGVFWISATDAGPPPEAHTNVEELLRNWLQPKPLQWRQELWIGASHARDETVGLGNKVRVHQLVEPCGRTSFTVRSLGS